MGRSVNDTIWDRWCPPEPSNYAELVSPCREYVYLGEINEEELNRLNFELKELSSMMADSQDEDTQNEVEVGVAINRGTSGGIKVLSGTIMIVGSVAGIAAVAASGGTALPVVVMALGTAMIMFGASDTIEGIGDIQAAISRQGLDQMSYNPVRESVFGGNETAYTLTEMGVSFVFDVITGMAIAKMPTRLKTPAQAFRATSAAGVATEAETVTVAKKESTVTWGMWEDLERGIYKGRQYAKINGRYYTKEAINRMTPRGYGVAANGYQARGITTNVVESVIKNGKHYDVVRGGAIRTIFEDSGIRVVTEESGNIVITAMKFS